MITGRLVAPAAAAPFSDAVIAREKLAFLAGQGLSRTGRPLAGRSRSRSWVTLQNIAAILEQLGVEPRPW
jgi:hypothetical protein